MATKKLERPDWVSPENWGEYLSLRHSLENGIDTDSGKKRSQRIIDKIATSKDCKCVWDAIQKRPAPRFTSPARDVLFNALRYSIGVAPWDAISAPDRKTQGAKIAKLARALEHELSSFPPLESPFCDALASVPRASFPAYSKELFAAEMLASRLDLTLDALAEAADAWATTAPPINHTRGRMAERKHFAKQMTAYFVRTYAEPLRAQTAAIVNAVFGCNLDARNIHEMAP
ncbi:MAG: hypothetical protein ACREPL_09340 [Rhodanobacteraceae bacterium]